MKITPFMQLELPPGLETLVEKVSHLATDLRWTWNHAADALWMKVDPHTWRRTESPPAVMQNLTRERLEELAADPQLRRQVERLAAAYEEYYSRPGWFGETHANSELRRIAYFSMEFGLGEALPLYAGGLGILAGDYLKAASDLGMPVVGIGLLYQEGYFRQMLDASGWQQETYPYNDSSSLPIRPVQSESGSWLQIPVNFPGRSVRLRVWQAQVGRVTLYLLDSNDPLNSPADRGLTSKLYGGGQELRLVQEIALGIGGWRVLDSLGFEVDVCHLNEGHAAFVTLERARRFMEQTKLDFWEALWADEIWTKACGKGRWLGAPEGLASAIEGLSDEALWSFRFQERQDLVNYARKRLAMHLGQHGADGATVSQADHVLDPNVLTLGFARRFTEYKRPTLLLHDPWRLARILTNVERPVQLIIAGKAHPQDEIGKHFIQDWVQFAQRPEVRAHVVFLEDYDMALAQKLVQGVDVWINTPRRPWEACGTSGMKVLGNGGLNRSELDGWWAEAYTPEVGWALGNGEEHWEPGWDAVEAEQLYRLLEQEAVPAFYDRDAAGVPRAWVARMRASMSRLAPQFSTNRMAREYVRDIYLPSATAFQRRVAQGGQLARELCDWESLLRKHWQELHFGNLVVNEEPDGWLFELQVYLADIPPDFVQVQLYAESFDSDTSACEVMERGAGIPGALNGYIYFYRVTALRPYTDFTPRIVACHREAHLPLENNLIVWWTGTAELRRNLR